MTKGRFSGSASGQAATRVNAEQASKGVMRGPTRHDYGEGCHHKAHRLRAGEAEGTNESALWPRRGSGGGMSTQEVVRNMGSPSGDGA